MPTSAGGVFLPGDPPPLFGAAQYLSSQDVTATGATGSTATFLTSVVPALVTVTGASGAGVQLPTGAAVPGAAYLVKNCMTGALKVYAVGGSINGTTGTTAFTLTATGNLFCAAMCTIAGAWQISGNT